MPSKRKRPPKREVEIVDPAYQPSKAEMEEKFSVLPMPLEEAARQVLAPVKVRRISRPRKK